MLRFGRANVLKEVIVPGAEFHVQARRQHFVAVTLVGRAEAEPRDPPTVGEPELLLAPLIVLEPCAKSECLSSPLGVGW